MMDDAYGLSKLDMLQLQKEKVESEMKAGNSIWCKKNYFYSRSWSGRFKTGNCQTAQIEIPEISVSRCFVSGIWIWSYNGDIKKIDLTHHKRHNNGY